MALLLLAGASQRRIRLDIISFTGAISACDPPSSWHSSLAILSLFRTAAVPADETLLTAALTACREHWHQTLYLFCSQDLNSTPTQVTYGALLCALDRSKQWQRSLTMLRRMAIERIAADHGIHAVAWKLALRGLDASAVDAWELALSTADSPEVAFKIVRWQLAFLILKARVWPQGDSEGFLGIKR
ncbi:unnamed protein product [Durusdinium trenchii]|uniref:Pentatricopeptide repeat-containing protein n=1 Tax=Durusdinium trenchii TaxID=1381693 RepID=A0ABP0NEY6_9DINO